VAPRPNKDNGAVGLFSARREALFAERAPLADRMRPRGLSEYIGQRHLLAPGKLLRRAIEADRVSSLILYGPPGTGKTTLARVIAAHSNATFRDLNAILSGVKVIREEIQGAQERMERFSQRTLLFIDEIHRFNQAQQDALLPWVERGVVTLIGATTENPYFEVNAALNSRSHIFQLQALSEEELEEVLQQALSDELRGYGRRDVELTREASAHWSRLVNGDARALLNALEVAVETTPPSPEGLITIDLAVAEESIQARAVVYDRSGDAHFDHMSALIKSLRGSDADASLYWLAKMVYAGEPARAIFRRLLIFASEDVGLAWPEGISVVNACVEAFDRVGMPEGRFQLAHAVLAMATAPKSNSTMGFFDALSAVERSPNGEVPLHLKDSNRDGESLGHGKGYLYPHAYAEHWVAQEHLPEALRGRVFYTPSQQGAERALGARHQALREAQLEGTLNSGAPPLIRSLSPHERGVEEWSARAMGHESRQWSELRDEALELLALERDSVTLDLNPKSGLFTWAALRASPEGGVYCWCLEERAAGLIQAQAAPLPWAHQPQVAWGGLSGLIEALQREGMRFDRVIAQGLLSEGQAPDQLASAMALALNDTGHATLLEPSAAGPSLLSPLLKALSSQGGEASALDQALLDAWGAAEAEALERARVREALLGEALKHEGLTLIEERSVVQTRPQRLGGGMIEQLCSANPGSYLSLLCSSGLSESRAEELSAALRAAAGLQLHIELSWRLWRLERAA